MTINLIEGNYEIGGLIFGTRDPRKYFSPYLVERFDVTPGYIITGIGGNLSNSSGGGGGGSNNADASFPNEDGIKFGQDYYTGMILTFSLNVWHRGNQVYEDIGKLKGVWRKKEFRQTSNTSTTLRMCRGGRTRLVYGRPRNFKETYGEVEQGWSPVDMDFQCADECFYDDELQTRNIGIDNPPVNGLTVPATVPFVLQQFQESYTTVHVRGDMPTWPLLTIHGPCTNPSIALDDDWKIDLLIGLDHTQVITIDPRPWVRMTLKRGVTIQNIAGKYTSTSPTMKQMAIEPGRHTMVYKAVDPTMTSYLEVNWRNAYGTP